MDNGNSYAAPADNRQPHEVARDSHVMGNEYHTPATDPLGGSRVPTDHNAPGKADPIESPRIVGEDDDCPDGWHVHRDSGELGEPTIGNHRDEIPVEDPEPRNSDEGHRDATDGFIDPADQPAYDQAAAPTLDRDPTNDAEWMTQLFDMIDQTVAALRQQAMKAVSTNSVQNWAELLRNQAQFVHEMDRTGETFNRMALHNQAEKAKRDPFGTMLEAVFAKLDLSGVVVLDMSAPTHDTTGPYGPGPSMGKGHPQG